MYVANPRSAPFSLPRSCKRANSQLATAPRDAAFVIGLMLASRPNAGPVRSHGERPLSALFDVLPTPRIIWGCPLREALAYAKARDPAAFRVLELQVQELDILHLGPQHCRARFSRSGDWAGAWCVP